MKQETPLQDLSSMLSNKAAEIILLAFLWMPTARVRSCYQKQLSL